MRMRVNVARAPLRLSLRLPLRCAQGFGKAGFGENEAGPRPRKSVVSVFGAAEELLFGMAQKSSGFLGGAEELRFLGGAGLPALR